MPKWISHEPVLWVAAVALGIDCAIVFGVPITPEQKTVVIGLVTAVLALFARSQVWSVAHVETVPAAAIALAEAKAAKA